MHDRPAPAPVEGRHDMYNAIHRGLRLGHARQIAQLSATDFEDPDACAAALDDLRTFLDLAQGHLHSEDTTIHPAVAARDPRAIDTAEQGHEQHEAAFHEIEALARAVEDAPPGRRSAAGARLYRRVVRFAADDFLHMEAEETGLLGAMHRLFDDDELRAVEGALIAAIPPARMTGYLRLIVAALSHRERLGMLVGMRAAMPHTVFAQLLTEAIRPALDPGDWARLDAALRQAA